MRTEHKNIKYFMEGNSRISKPSAQIVFQLCYGNKDFTDISADPMKMGIRMASDCYPVDFVETWYAEHNAQFSTGHFHAGKLRYVETGGSILIFGELGRLQDIENSTFDAYQAIFKTLHTKGYHFLLRSWNFIPKINGFNEAGIENYQAFCKSRALAYIDANIKDEQMPAATGIGSYSKNICGYLLASKRSDYRHLENALQRPAYEYPRRCGPKSPSFARATIRNDVA
jgi:hypothetical protein